MAAHLKWGLTHCAVLMRSVVFSQLVSNTLTSDTYNKAMRDAHLYTRAYANKGAYVRTQHVCLCAYTQALNVKLCRHTSTDIHTYRHTHIHTNYTHN